MIEEARSNRFNKITRCMIIALLLFLTSASCSRFTFKNCTSSTFKVPDVQSASTLRFAQFNIKELSTKQLIDLDKSGAGRSEQLLAAAAVIQKVNADILIINEIDHDIDALTDGKGIALNAHRFNDAFLNQGKTPVSYPYIYAALCNTGFLAGKDFDNNDKVATDEDRGSRDHGGDCYGYGAYPGQYAMAIYSRYALDTENARTFQNFLWKNLPDNLIPTEWYSEDEVAIFRLSSKSHWDVPVKIGKKSIHLLVSHPTPPGFDGDDDRNGRRNYDEVRMLADYISENSSLVDDNGTTGGLAADASFVIIGDLNASPQGDFVKGNSLRAIDQLLNHPRIIETGALMTSKGGAKGAKTGAPKFAERSTASWGDGSRVDYLLPSEDLKPISGGVYWPDAGEDEAGAALAEKASDHHMIWLDIELK